MFDDPIPLFSHPTEGTVFARQNLDVDHCFLCGVALTNENRTDEHVIPRWLQRRFDLWDQRLTLPNRTGIAYRHQKVPCCHSCNTGVLATLEAEIEAAMAAGFHQFRQLREERLFQWCGKIFYGILFRDTQLIFDRGIGGGETIVDRELLNSLFTLHLFLQSLYVPFEFVGFIPHSVFVVETAKFDDIRADFELHHYFIVATPEAGPKPVAILALRCADVGIICVFLDNGLQKELCQHIYDEFNGIPLAPIQFDEFVCNATCKEYSRNYPSRYASWSDRGRVAGCRVEQEHSPIAGPMFGDFNPRLFLDMLVGLGGRYMAPPLKQEFEQLAANENIVLTPTFLFDDKHRPLRYVDGHPRPALILPLSYRERD